MAAPADQEDTLQRGDFPGYGLMIWIIFPSDFRVWADSSVHLHVFSLAGASAALRLRGILFGPCDTPIHNEGDGAMTADVHHSNGIAN